MEPKGVPLGNRHELVEKFPKDQKSMRNVAGRQRSPLHSSEWALPSQLLEQEVVVSLPTMVGVGSSVQFAAKAEVG